APALFIKNILPAGLPRGEPLGQVPEFVKRFRSRNAAQVEAHRARPLADPLCPIACLHVTHHATNDAVNKAANALPKNDRHWPMDSRAATMSRHGCLATDPGPHPQSEEQHGRSREAFRTLSAHP